MRALSFEPQAAMCVRVGDKNLGSVFPEAKQTHMAPTELPPGLSTSRLLRQATVGATLLASGQGASRLFTFVGNLILLREMGDPRPFGVSNVTLHFVHSLSLGLSREGVRRAVLRDPSPDAALSSQLARTYALFGALTFAPLATWYFLSQPAPDGIAQPQYANSLLMVFAAILVELLSEPMFVLAQTRLEYRMRSGLDAASALVRVAVSLFCCHVLHWALEAFAAGYLAASCTLFLGYCWCLGLGSARQALLGRLGPASVTSLGAGAQAMSVQAAWKLALAEGENVVMLATGTVPSDQGAFGLAANLGSLVARMLLQPCEEAAYTVFGKMRPGPEVDRVLGCVVRLFCMFGLLFACLAAQYTHLLILVLYSKAWCVERTSRGRPASQHTNQPTDQPTNQPTTQGRRNRGRLRAVVVLHIRGISGRERHDRGLRPGGGGRTGNARAERLAGGLLGAVCGHCTGLGAADGHQWPRVRQLRRDAGQKCAQRVVRQVQAAQPGQLHAGLENFSLVWLGLGRDHVVPAGRVLWAARPSPPSRAAPSCGSRVHRRGGRAGRRFSLLAG
jgi:hypothetical protein